MNKPIPWDEMSDRAMPWHTTFIGQSMQHNYWLHAILDRVMVANPQIESIIEIGTGAGGLSIFFGLWGLKRKIDVLSIDSVKRHDAELLDYLDVYYSQIDEMSDKAKGMIDDYANDLPTLLFCDGGCKRNEFRFYAPRMPVGSIVCAHDLGNEFCHEIDGFDVPGVEKYHEEWWNEMNAQVAIYKRV